MMKRLFEGTHYIRVVASNAVGKMIFQRTILTFLLIPTILLGQNLPTVKKYDFGKFVGYCFTKEHNHEISWDFKNKTDFFTPDSLEILKFEDEIARQYVSANERFLKEKQWKNFDDNINSYPKNVAKREMKARQKTLKSVQKRQRRLSDFDRQYLGYIKSNGDKIIFVYFLNTKADKEGRDFGKSLDKQLIIGFGDWYERNSFSLSYNLTTNQLSLD